MLNLHSKIHDDCFNHETLMSLFNTSISCILSYGCETWGSHKDEDFEKVHLNFLKRTLKVRRSVVNCMVYFELGRVPMYVERYYRMIKYWCKILKTENIVLNICYESMFESSHKKLNKKFNWTGNICVDMVSMIYGSLKMLLMKIDFYVNLNKELLIVL